MLYPNNKNLMKRVHFGVGYKTTAADTKTVRGVVHLNFVKEDPPLEGMSEEETEAHLVG